MMKDNSAAIQQQAASATIGLPQLQAAFANIYATMDSIDTFKLQALDSMSTTITTLETEVGKSREYLDRVSQRRPAAGVAARSTSRAAAPAVCAELRTVPDPARHTGSELDGVQGLGGQDHRPARAGTGGGHAEPGRAPTEQDIMNALDRVEAMVAGGVVPAPVQSRVKRVTSTVRQTMPRLRNLGLGSPEAYSVMATATDYLPEAISGYLRLPRDWADSRPIEAGQDLADAADRPARPAGLHDGQDLRRGRPGGRRRPVAHGRFLQEKFGHPGNTPTAPPMSPAVGHPA